MGYCWGGRVAPAAIERVNQIQCPILGVFGDDDKSPSPQDVTLIYEALTNAEVAHEFHQYEGAGHGFQDFHNPERYRPTQAEDGWSKFFAFMSRRLV
jgi:carboxymethylenebutenolidase